MGGKGGNVRFRLGLAATLVSICLSVYIIGRAQTGPSWEVPVAVMEQLRTVPTNAMGLAITGALFAFWSRRKEANGMAVWRWLLVLLLIAVALPFGVWLFEPEQWPFRYVTLSSIASVLIVPVVIASAALFWLIGWRWARATF